jgi:hypothetical protein
LAKKSNFRISQFSTWENAGKSCRSIQGDFCITISRSAEKRLTEKAVSWTTGTGVIDPLDFDIGGKHYQLELRRSDKLGKLQENELVIWQANPPA